MQVTRRFSAYDAIVLKVQFAYVDIDFITNIS